MTHTLQFLFVDYTKFLTQLEINFNHSNFLCVDCHVHYFILYIKVFLCWKLLNTVAVFAMFPLLKTAEIWLVVYKVHVYKGQKQIKTNNH